MIFRIRMAYCKKIFTFSLLFFFLCTVISLEFLTRISSFFYQTLVSNFFNSITSIDTTFNGNEIADAISSLYNEIILLCLVIVVLVLGILTFIERNHSSYYGFLESLTFSTFGSSFSKKLKFNFSSVKFTSKAEGYLDLAFLLFPSSIIFYIIVPTLGFLYNKDINVDSTLSSFSVDIVGHQWYWSYSYNISLLDGNNLFCTNPITGDDFMDFITDSYIEFDSILDMDSKYLRLLNVDHCFILPVHTNIRLSLTSVDVIHSWAVPQLGIKVDTIPGRITGCNLHSYAVGTFYGQCSELCGVNHGFMPIVVEIVSAKSFFNWYLESMGFSISSIL